MPKKMGRPKADKTIEKRLGVRLDSKTREELEKWCKDNNKSISEAIRMGIHLLLGKK